MPRVNEIQFLREKLAIAKANGWTEEAGDLERRLNLVLQEVDRGAA